MKIHKLWSHLGTNSVPNGFPMHPHGLILGEDGATARTDLLDTFPAGFGGVWGGVGGSLSGSCVQVVVSW